MTTRVEKLKNLEAEYMKTYSGCFYPKQFEAQASMLECNFGGVLCILSLTGESVIVWRDWSDAAISDHLTECEIFFDPSEDDDEDAEPCFLFEDTIFSLSNFMKI